MSTEQDMSIVLKGWHRLVVGAAAGILLTITGQSGLSALSPSKAQSAPSFSRADIEAIAASHAARVERESAKDLAAHIQVSAEQHKQIADSLAKLEKIAEQTSADVRAVQLAVAKSEARN